MEKQKILVIALAGLFAAAISNSCNENGSSNNNETGDVYVAGYECEGNDKYIVKIWKNDKVLRTFTDNIIVKSIFVSGNDVYMAGYNKSIATVWKNGQVVHTLTDECDIDGIFISGNDLYVAGREWEAGSNSSAGKIWKNGQVLYAFPHTDIFSIFVKQE
ncbi:MAG: hypothetical protein LBD52_02410 [Prevotellaceae bacterium]|jgi:hypothetical protein|nr:hypothetical protein [Prevotellaceae bacterium]